MTDMMCMHMLLYLLCMLLYMLCMLLYMLFYILCIQVCRAHPWLIC